MEMNDEIFEKNGICTEQAETGEYGQKVIKNFLRVVSFICIADL